MTVSLNSIGVDTADLPVQCTCGCVHCCAGGIKQQTTPAWQELKEARPLKRKHHELLASTSPKHLFPKAQISISKEEKESEKPEEKEDSKSLLSVPDSDTFANKQHYRCDFCNAEFTLKRSLTAHVQQHSLQQHKTSACNGSISVVDWKKPRKSEKEELCSQAAIPHQQIASERPAHQCELCSSVFQSTATLYNHIQKVHHDAQHQAELLRALRGSTLQFCEVCGKAFCSRNSLAAHSSVHSEMRKHICPVCQKCFLSRAGLRAHAVTHKRLKRFQCALCGAAFAKKDSLSTHLLKHSGERPFQCDTCGASFDRRFTLKNHQTLHSGERPHVCSACGKSFPTRGALTAHERATHTGRHKWPNAHRRPRDFKSAVCEQCGKVFSNAANLRIHVHTHSGARPFLCSVCGAAFGKKYTLQCHMRRHTNERPYACNECGAAFFRQSTLATHQRRHTGERPHCCKLCGRRFIQSASLIYHLKHHDHIPEKSSIALSRESEIPSEKVLTVL